ncbi:MAG: hypothetical protein ACYTG0_37680 [Planctomycetota bacterium]|jgi:hypothetical protein
MTLKADVLAELDELIKVASHFEASFRKGHYLSDTAESEFREFTTAARAAVARIAGKESEYYSLPEGLPVQLRAAPIKLPSYLAAFQGVLAALRKAVDQGLLESLESRLRANVHDDFLEQSRSLLSAGYHVGAMVLIGAVLEDHLRKLCVARGLSWSGNGNLSKYNDLLRDNAYDQPVWRRIQAIGDVRNLAAHGEFAKVKVDDVEDAHKAVGRYLADYPS